MSRWQSAMRALILAAGKGTRLNPLTVTRPKHLLPIAGKPLLARTLKILADIGLKEIGIVVHYYADKIKSVFGDGSKYGVKIKYIYQKVLNGTGGAIEVAESFLKGGDCLVVYGDVTLDRNVLEEFIKFFEREQPDALILGVRVSNPREFGVLITKGKFLVNILEKPKDIKIESNLINAGVYLLKPRVLEALKRISYSSRGEKELTDALRVLSRDGKVLVFDGGSGWWYDIGRPWDLIDANKKFLSTLKTDIRSKSLSDVRIIGDVIIEENTEILPGSVIIGPTYIGSEVTIGYNSVIGPYTSIGNNVEIGPLCYIAGSIIMNGVNINSHCSVFESIIGEGVYLECGVKIPSVNIYGGEIRVWVKGKKVNCGRSRLGAIIGDRVKVGANASFAPGVVVAPNNTIPPNSYVREDIIE